MKFRIAAVLSLATLTSSFHPFYNIYHAKQNNYLQPRVSTEIGAIEGEQEGSKGAKLRPSVASLTFATIAGLMGFSQRALAAGEYTPPDAVVDPPAIVSQEGSIGWEDGEVGAETNVKRGRWGRKKAAKEKEVEKEEEGVARILGGGGGGIGAEEDGLVGGEGEGEGEGLHSSPIPSSSSSSGDLVTRARTAVGTLPPAVQKLSFGVAGVAGVSGSAVLLNQYRQSAAEDEKKRKEQYNIIMGIDSEGGGSGGAGGAREVMQKPARGVLGDEWAGLLDEPAPVSAKSQVNRKVEAEGAVPDILAPPCPPPAAALHSAAVETAPISPTPAPIVPVPSPSPPPPPPKKKSFISIRKKASTATRETDIFKMIAPAGSEGSPKDTFSGTLTSYLTFGAPGR